MLGRAGFVMLCWAELCPAGQDCDGLCWTGLSCSADFDMLCWAELGLSCCCWAGLQGLRLGRLGLIMLGRSGLVFPWLGWITVLHVVSLS